MPYNMCLITSKGVLIRRYIHVSHCILIPVVNVNHDLCCCFIVLFLQIFHFVCWRLISAFDQPLIVHFFLNTYNQFINKEHVLTFIIIIVMKWDTCSFWHVPLMMWWVRYCNSEINGEEKTVKFCSKVVFFC